MIVNINSGFKVTCDIIAIASYREYDAAAVSIIMFEMRDVTTVKRVNIEYVETYWW